MAKAERTVVDTRCDACGRDMTDELNYGELLPGGKPPMLMEPYDSNTYDYGVVCYVTRGNGQPIDICADCMLDAMEMAKKRVTRG